MATTKVRSRSLPALNHMVTNAQFSTNDSNPFMDCPPEEPTTPWLDEELENVFLNNPSEDSIAAHSLPDKEILTNLSWNENTGGRRVSSLSDIYQYYQYYELIRRHSDHLPCGYPNHLLLTSAPTLDDVPPECPAEAMFIPYQSSIEDYYIDDDSFFEDMDSFSLSTDIWDETDALIPERDPLAIDDLPEEERDDSMRNGVLNYNCNNLKMYFRL